MAEGRSLSRPQPTYLPTRDQLLARHPPSYTLHLDNNLLNHPQKPLPIFGWIRSDAHGPLMSNLVKGLDKPRQRPGVERMPRPEEIEHHDTVRPLSIRIHQASAPGRGVRLDDRHVLRDRAIGTVVRRGPRSRIPDQEEGVINGVMVREELGIHLQKAQERVLGCRVHPDAIMKLVDELVLDALWREAAVGNVALGEEVVVGLEVVRLPLVAEAASLGVAAVKEVLHDDVVGWRHAEETPQGWAGGVDDVGDADEEAVRVCAHVVDVWVEEVSGEELILEPPGEGFDEVFPVGSREEG